MIFRWLEVMIFCCVEFMIFCRSLEIQAAGPAQIKFAYFGREGALQTRVTNADDWPMDRGRAGCVCGCYVQTGDIPGNATRAYSGSRYPWGPFSRPP